MSDLRCPYCHEDRLVELVKVGGQWQMHCLVCGRSSPPPSMTNLTKTWTVSTKAM